MGRVTARIIESTARQYERRADRTRDPVRRAALRARAVDERRKAATHANGSVDLTRPIPAVGRDHRRPGRVRRGQSGVAVLVCVVGILAVLVVAGIAGSPTGERTSTAASTEADGDGLDPGPSTPAVDGDALAALDELDVKGRAPLTGYDRDEFPHWSTDDGCDTRAAILERDALPGTVVRDSDGCVVGAGVSGPYTARALVEDPGAASDVDIDHVVALADVWRSGAAQLDRDEREEFANDPLNLLAVDDATNQAKGDSNAASWLPPNRAFRCDYVARQVAVKSEYDLWVTAAERDAIARVLAGCPSQPLPAA